VQALRSPSDIQTARDDAQSGIESWLRSALGPAWVDQHGPRVLPLLTKVRADLSPYAHVSPHPRRARPSERDRRVQPVLPFHHGAYPSARTQATFVWAEVVGELRPEVLAPLRAYAARSAWLRVVGGVHYPTDLEGGRRVASAFLGALRASGAYQRERDAQR
jgi:acid phosphatase (class A)